MTPPLLLAKSDSEPLKQTASYKIRFVNDRFISNETSASAGRIIKRAQGKHGFLLAPNANIFTSPLKLLFFNKQMETDGCHDKPIENRALFCVFKVPGLLFASN